jgi:hypothetical protein
MKINPASISFHYPQEAMVTSTVAPTPVKGAA